MLFDTQAYLTTCDWLGEVVDDAPCLMASCAAGIDLRGSWPYGSFPDRSVLSHSLFTRALTWTGVIRPDTSLPEEQYLPRSTVTPLKPHYAHIPGTRPAYLDYSARTRKRISQSAATWFVSWESLTSEVARFAVEQQAQLAVARNIPAVSNPSPHHFFELTRINSKLLIAGTLRRRSNRALEGVLILTSGGPKSWHAHSSLCTPRAQLEHGTLLLWHEALGHWSADHEIWWGGAPFNAPSIATFKKRFSNHESIAHLVNSVLVSDEAYERVLDEYGRHAWLPQHRPPPVEFTS